MHSYW